MPSTRNQAFKKPTTNVITRGQRAREMVTPEQTSEVELSSQKVGHRHYGNITHERLKAEY